MKETAYSIITTLTLGLLIAIVGFLVVIMVYPFHPATFYRPVIHTPIVSPGDLFHFDMVLDKHTDISPNIQRTLVCGDKENIIVLETAIGTSRTGDKRVRSIRVEIPKKVDIGDCQILTHISYSYFGGFRNVIYDIWTDKFSVVPSKDKK